jgi:hypothetical protein
MIKEKTTTYVDENPVPGLGLAQKCIGSKLKKGITTICLLDNWIYNDNTDINKQKNVYLARRIG